MKSNEKIIVGLIAGRHPLPVTGYIFNESIDDVTDFNKIEDHILNFVEAEVGYHETQFGQSINGVEVADSHVWEGDRPLVVYVTGLTSVTAALIKVCLNRGIKLTLMHFDASTANYIPQVIN